MFLNFVVNTELYKVLQTGLPCKINLPVIVLKDLLPIPKRDQLHTRLNQAWVQNRIKREGYLLYLVTDETEAALKNKICSSVSAESISPYYIYVSGEREPPSPTEVFLELMQK